MKLPESWTTVTLLSKIIAIILFVLLPFIGFYFGYMYRDSLYITSDQNVISKKVLTKIPIEPTMFPSTIPSLAPTVSVSTPTLPEDKKLFSNSQLGISFVIPLGDSNMAGIKVVGNKVYVYDTKYPYDQGQYLEVFKKSSIDTLEQAIQKRLLVNIFPDECFVKDFELAKSRYPITYQLKTLGYKTDPASELPPWAQDNKCPGSYEESNGLSYFLADSLHPDIFLFVSIGQYGLSIEKGGSVLWQDTILFL